MSESNRVSRRRFLKRTAGLGAAGFAAPYFVPSGVLAAPGRTGANDKIQVALLGSGGQGRGFHLKTLLTQQDVVVTAVCDVWQSRLAEAVEMCKGTAKGYGDYRQVLNRDDVDAVVIASPPHWHALMAIHACEAKKDVYIEKPMTLSVGEALAVLRAADKHQRITQVGTQVHATANYGRIVDIIRSGALGKVSIVRTFHVLNQGPRGIGQDPDQIVPEGLDWEMWKGPGADRPFSHLLVKDSYHHPSFMYSGGWTPGMAPHIVDLPYWALELGYPTVTSASGGRYIIRDAGDAYDTHEVVWQYPNLTMTWCTSMVNSYAFDLQGEPGRNRRRGIYFHGVNGTMIADYNFRKIVPEGDLMKDYKEEDVPKVIPDSPGHHREWLDGIRTRKQPSCHVGYHYKLDIAINLSMMALQLGRSVRFDPTTGAIPNDAEANKLWLPPYRAPWKIPAEYVA